MELFYMKKYKNFSSNLKILTKAFAEDLTNEFIISGIIDKFFIQFELGWKLFKETLRYEGLAVASTGSPREIIKAAYKCYDFMDEELWLKMLRSRNDMTHIYDGDKAKQLVNTIIKVYIPEFQKIEKGLLARYEDKLNEF